MNRSDSLFRLAFITAMFSMLICGTSCIAPLPSKVSVGHKYSKESLNFLSLPDATRDEALATLGPPLTEDRNLRVLLYAWETIDRYLEFNRSNSIRHGYSQEWGLFIAYDQSGHILAHEVRPIEMSDMEQQCVQWSRARFGNHESLPTNNQDRNQTENPHPP